MHVVSGPAHGPPTNATNQSLSLSPPSLLVNVRGAGLPDLPVVAAREHLEPAHVGHGDRVVGEELVGRRRGGHPLHVRSRPAVVHERLVGEEQTRVAGHVAVVAQVELVGGGRVHVHRGVVVLEPGLAPLPEPRRVRLVQRRVLHAFPAVVVETVRRERRALRAPDRVAPCKLIDDREGLLSNRLEALLALVFGWLEALLALVSNGS